MVFYSRHLFYLMRCQLEYHLIHFMIICYHCQWQSDHPLLSLSMENSFSLKWLIVPSVCAVIDILRMIILHPDGATILLKHVNDANGILF